MEWDLRTTSNLNSNHTSQLTTTKSNDPLHKIPKNHKTSKTLTPKRWRQQPNLVKVGVGKDGKLLLDRLNEANSDVESIVGAMGELRWVPDRSKRTACLGLNVVGTRRVPSETTITIVSHPSPLSTNPNSKQSRTSKNHSPLFNIQTPFSPNPKSEKTAK